MVNGGFFTVQISLGRFLSRVVDTKYDEIRNTVKQVFNVVKEGCLKGVDLQIVRFDESVSENL